ncbi:hypothetical protein Achl_4424 (plasmid) [Pseudarthrobacter chlorophenolicus A6]|uniref:Uncharacterized protein n=1 Tax=Pseudarthrobacter chlorophenolicus (strain ATCC 700700 / DSM 12829 / CIP 107037 / JCM 12360 / KCTC 9906 / NCIMB 13794 / A6) TaxID=452863 RepID=B8HIX8_PSECP|nr:hypothetical protein [Pseudarthrobacter chlorophenolicus]ACL42375.1 hypothetical protein Achl_4424 [Pseudarthrobacter chlorophenolicus A6]SDQ17254.1 hypothetical protein SAMN04489738_0481 [Pseudarthrobacter chlorophenolicus]
MTADGINRAPAGIPSGGQFVATNHAEAPIRLFDRTDGSFLNPAPSATAEHCIQFWSNVEIPDEIIDQVVDAYATFRQKEIDQDMEQHMTAWRTHWEEQNPVPKRNLEEYQERFKREYEQHRQSVLPGVVAKRPERLGQYDTRQLIRATKMLIHRPNPARFPPEEEQKVLDEPVELYNETLTVRQIDQKYSLYDVRYAMDKVFRNDNALLEALQSQSEQLSGIHEQLVHQRSDFNNY